jgi:hypothetical protein
MINGTLEITTTDIILVTPAGTVDYGPGTVHVANDHVVVRIVPPRAVAGEIDVTENQVRIDELDQALTKIKMVVGLPADATVETTVQEVDRHARLFSATVPSPGPREG